MVKNSMLTIGLWIERESREVQCSPSSYAADWEILKTRPGRYPVKLRFSTGYQIPMPDTLHFGIEADRIAGKTYSGMGGVNYASSDLPLVPKKLSRSPYIHSLHSIVSAGDIELFPMFADIMEYTREFEHYDGKVSLMTDAMNYTENKLGIKSFNHELLNMDPGTLHWLKITGQPVN